MLYQQLAICLLAISVLVPAVKSCMCLWEHEQAAYCRGANAMEFRVEDRSIVYYSNGQLVEVGKTDSRRWLGIRFYKYKITDLTIYQASSNLKREFSYVISDYDLSCRQTLEVGATYAVIGGYSRGDGFSVNSCTHVVRMDNLNTFAQSAIRLNMDFMFKESCGKCKATHCRYSFDDCSKMENFCDVSDFGKNYRPFESVCISLNGKSKSPACEWFSEDFLPTVPKEETKEEGSGYEDPEYSGW